MTRFLWLTLIAIAGTTSASASQLRFYVSIGPDAASSTVELCLKRNIRRDFPDATFDEAIAWTTGPQFVIRIFIVKGHTRPQQRRQCPYFGFESRPIRSTEQSFSWPAQRLFWTEHPIYNEFAIVSIKVHSTRWSV